MKKYNSIIYAPYIPLHITTAFGYQAGVNIRSGINNVCIGSSTGLAFLNIQHTCLRCGGNMEYFPHRFVNDICSSCQTIMMEYGEKKYQRLFKLYKKLNRI